MTYQFGLRSSELLQKAHPDLVSVIELAMYWQVMDFAVIETLRTKERQQHLVNTGASKTMNSKHLMQEDGFSHAADIVPWPIDWQDTGRFYILNGIIRASASHLNVNIRTGADWDSDGLIQDQRFHDLPHIELRR